MTSEEAKLDPRVIAIRADKLVGAGTCSSIDECMEDSELVEELDRLKIVESRTAVKWARMDHRLYLEQGTNCSSGEANCPLVKAYRDFKRAMQDNPL